MSTYPLLAIPRVEQPTAKAELGFSVRRGTTEGAPTLTQEDLALQLTTVDPDAPTPRKQHGTATALYPVSDLGHARIFAAAITLLDGAVAAVQSAIEALRESDIVRSDYEAGRIRALLPELFCCRTLGDGFGSVVVALAAAFDNQAGQPMTSAHLEAVSLTVGALRNAPYLAMDRAVERISQMQDAGLDVDPRGLSLLSSVIDV